jgi:Flp pilus assembly protein TadG
MIRQPRTRRPRSAPRTGATLVETAIVCPLALFLTLGLIIGGLGISRYQQVAALSREASRWASVHGTQWAKDSGSAATTATSVFNNAIQPKMVALFPNCVSYTVNWSPDQRAGSAVTVTLTYQWTPEAFLTGPITLTSTSVETMLY